MSRARVAFLDHTADVGFELTTATPEALFDAAARAMLALLRGEEERDGAAEAQQPGSHRSARTVALARPDPARLLAEWLRELLFLHEVEKLDYAGADFELLRLDPSSTTDGACRLEARVRLAEGGHAVREIKGVTYHEIEARPTPNGWRARVIFDV